jgi:H+/gluconate symporter-like permease
MRVLPDLARHRLPVLVGLVVGAAVGAFAGGMAALFVPEEFSGEGFLELVLILAVAGAVAGLILDRRR